LRREASDVSPPDSTGGAEQRLDYGAKQNCNGPCVCGQAQQGLVLMGSKSTRTERLIEAFRPWGQRYLFTMTGELSSALLRV
jgi:hypothetical protein